MLLSHEWIVVGYFVYLAGVAAFVPGVAPHARFLALATVAVLAVPLYAGASGAASAIREWLPLVYLLAGYWLPGRLVATPNIRFERWLQSVDDRLFARRLEPASPALPRALVELLEVAYLFCYPFVPLGFAWLRTAEAGAVDRFWTAVLVAGFCCYGALPWLPTRSPRAIAGGPAGRSVVRSANRWVLDRASVHWNTFPSGHVATAFATALVVVAEQPGAGAVFLLIAAAIAAGSVTGRYHYAADACAGAAVAATAFLVSRLVPPL